MKYRTTKRDIQANYTTVSIGYCELQDLLAYEEPEAYTCGVYGWNADIYSFGGIAIVTGYRPFGKIHLDYEMIRKYNDTAKKIRCGAGDYDTRKAAVKKLLDDFINEIIEIARKQRKKTA